VGRGRLTDEQMVRCQRLLPHLKRTLDITVRTGVLRGAAALGQRALDAIDDGVVVVDAALRIVYSNLRADALLNKGNCLQADMARLRARGALQTRLEDSIRRVQQSGRSEGLRLPMAESGGPSDAFWLLLISRLPQKRATPLAAFAAVSQPNALVFIVAPGRQRVVGAHQLMQLFGLTPAEARLAHGLARGQAIEEYRTTQGLRMATVRTQLRAVLAKTGAARQHDLMRLLAGLPSVRDG
jgi:DNA-binding CsgD family transcriptional regulator